MQEQIGQMLDSITCTPLPLHIHKWHNDNISSIKPGEKRPRAADIKVPDAHSCYTDFMDFPVKKATKENICVGYCLREDYTMGKLALFLLFYTKKKLS